MFQAQLQSKKNLFLPVLCLFSESLRGFIYKEAHIMVCRMVNSACIFKINAVIVFTNKRIITILLLLFFQNTIESLLEITVSFLNCHQWRPNVLVLL